MEMPKRYEREHSDRLAGEVMIDKVVFSPTRNSCVAKAIEIEASDTWEYKVTDILTNDEESAGDCNMSRGECGKGNDTNLMRKQDKLFEWFVTSDRGEKNPF